MSTLATVQAPVNASNGRSNVLDEVSPPVRFVCGANLPKREQVAIPATTFQALSPPSGAIAVRIEPSTNPSLTLKGLTGDSGIALTPASGVAGVPILLPLGASPSIGIYNGGGSSVTLDVIWI